MFNRFKTLEKLKLCVNCLQSVMKLQNVGSVIVNIAKKNIIQRSGSRSTTDQHSNQIQISVLCNNSRRGQALLAPALVHVHEDNVKFYY